MSLFYKTFINIFLLLIPVMLLLYIFAASISPGTQFEDFSVFFMGAQIIESGQANNLYNLNTQERFQYKIFKNTRPLSPYFNPPFAVLPLVSFVKFGITNSHYLWATFNALSVFGIIFIIFLKFLREKLIIRIVAAILPLAFVPVIICLIIGQWGLFLTFLFLLSWYLFEKGSFFKSGATLSLIFIKPQLLILPLITLTSLKNRRALWGTLTGITVLCLISVLTVGILGISEYIQLLLNASKWNKEFEINTYTQPTIQNLIMIAAGNNSPEKIRLLWFVFFLIISGIVAITWHNGFAKKSAGSGFFWALLILGTLLVSLHTHLFDLSMLLCVNIMFLWEITKNPSGKVKTLLALMIAAGYIWFTTITFASIYNTFSNNVIVVGTTIFMLVEFIVVYFLTKGSKKT